MGGTYRKYCVDKYGFDEDIKNSANQVRCAKKMIAENPRNIFQWTTASKCL
jgi:hypothetical protein